MKLRTILIIGLIVVFVGVPIAMLAYEPFRVAVGNALYGVWAGVLSPTIGNVRTAIAGNPIWMTYGNFICVGIGFITGLVVFFFGHGFYNWIRGGMVRSAAKETGFMGAPIMTQTPQVIQTQPVPQAPQVVQQPTTQPANPEEQNKA